MNELLRQSGLAIATVDGVRLYAGARVDRGRFALEIGATAPGTDAVGPGPGAERSGSEHGDPGGCAVHDGSAGE